MTNPGGNKDEIAAALQAANCKAAWCVVDISTGEERGERSDDLVVTASTYKTAVLLEVNRQAQAGELNLTDRVKVPANRRTLGPTGLSVMLDDVDISIRDLTFWMMCVSDNTATDVLQEIVGTDRVNKTMADLGLGSTFLEGDCHHLLSTLIEDVGGIEKLTPALTADQIAGIRSLNASQTNRTSPRDAANLLRLIWTDGAASPESCAEVRRVMGLQVWPHRLSSAFGDGIKVSGKTGTLIGIKNEIGVVEFPGGGKYAAAVFVTTNDLSMHQPAADAVIGTIARLAIEDLRGE